MAQIVLIELATAIISSLEYALSPRTRILTLPQHERISLMTRCNSSNAPSAGSRLEARSLATNKCFPQKQTIRLHWGVENGLHWTINLWKK